MTKQKINKSDFADRKGVVHDSIGENIRSDNNQLSVDYLNSMSEDERLMFPFLPFKKGKWVTVTDTVVNGKHKTDKFFIHGTSSVLIVSGKIKFSIVESSTLDIAKSYMYSSIPGTYLGEKIYYISFSNPLTTDNNGDKIIFKCYVEDE